MASTMGLSRAEAGVSISRAAARRERAAARAGAFARAWATSSSTGGAGIGAWVWAAAGSAISTISGRILTERTIALLQEKVGSPWRAGHGKGHLSWER